MDDHDLGQGLRKVPEQSIATLDAFVTFAQRVKQAIDRVRELRRFGVVGNR